MALGFKNFPMDRFGVVSPKLKAEVKTPILPGAEAAQPPREDGSRAAGGKPNRDDALYTWLGAKIKNVVGMGEVSSLGLPGETGVLLVDVPKGRPAAKAGLQASDVILECNGTKVGAVADLLRLYRSAAPGNKVKLGVVREQSEITIEVIRNG